MFWLYSNSMAAITEELVRTIVREETSGMRVDVANVKADMAELKIDLRLVHTRLTDHDNQFSEIKNQLDRFEPLIAEVRRLSVLAEEQSSILQTISENLSMVAKDHGDSSDLKQRVDKLELHASYR